MIQRYMLDTNTVSYIVKGKSSTARARLASLDKNDVACISTITEGEIRYGLAKAAAAHPVRSAIEGFLAKIQILPWGRLEADAYGNLRAKLEASGNTLGNLDMLIAAHAIALDAVLVSNDRAFSRVDDLRATVNWAADL